MRLSRAQLNKAINDRIKSEFTNVPIQSSDVEEGFSRPSFYVSLETNNSETSQFSTLRDMTCRILFFPTDRHIIKEEAYDVADRLETLFGLNFQAGDRVITIGGAQTDIIDKVLHYDFDFSYYEEISSEEEPGELMEELDFNG